jgi:L-malate glycosyltransferase
MARHRVLFLSRYIPQFRLAFLSTLRDYCARADIDLQVVYGNPGRDDARRNDAVDFASGVRTQNRFVRLGRMELVWQPALRYLPGADLVIVDQQNKLLINYLLIVRQWLGLQKFAFYGHGRNRQAHKANSLSETFKRTMLRLPHWWFAYTDDVADYLAQSSFDRERITTVYNAIDTASLKAYRAAITDSELSEIKRELGIDSDRVGIYVGSMYPDKDIPFLLEACLRIKASVPDFFMLFIGAGSDATLVAEFCRNHPWARYLGPRFGRDKVKYCMVSRLLLLPGLVGLAILDGFAMRLPIVTTHMLHHGPEIEYLRDGYNGVIVAHEVDAYAAAATALLTDAERLAKMADNCEQSAAKYTIENMASRFLDGIRRALPHPPDP